MRAHSRCLALTLALGACSDASIQFPKAMLFGTSSSAYQVEGSDHPSGKVASNWQEWEALGKVAERQHNPSGAGFWTRYDEDFALAQGMGHNAYRLGLEWARIEPVQGQFDRTAIAHYREVLMAARARGLEPVVTLYHWVVPAWVQSPRSGLDLLARPPTYRREGARVVLESAFADSFAPFVELMGRELGDLVDTWVVLNEPYSVLVQSYLTATHPNGRVFDLGGVRNAALSYIIAYPAAYDALERGDLVDADGDGRATLVGNAVVGAATYPHDPARPSDQRAAQRLSYLVNEWMMNAWSTGALDVNLDGDTDDAQGILPEGLYAEQLGGRLDYVGFNYYAPLRARHCAGLHKQGGSDVRISELAKNLSVLPLVSVDTGAPRAENGLEIHAPAFLDTLRLYAKYTEGGARPILITENGTSDCDDDQRTKFLVEHLEQLGLALREGLAVRGYLHWSLTDNFEWKLGRTQCMGLYRVDYRDFSRHARSTVPVYRDIVTSRRLDEGLLRAQAAAPYPSDCRGRTGDERAECLQAQGQNPLAVAADAVKSLCD